MASLTLATEHRRALNDLSTVTGRDVTALWRQIEDLAPEQLTTVLLDAIPAITDAYGDVAAVLAVDHYDEARALARAPGTYHATAAELAGLEQVQAVVRWAVGPLWSETPDYAQALDNVLSGTDRLVRQPGRATIAENTRRDVTAESVVRLTRPDACGFCLLMATRPDHATLTGASPGRWHSNCRCGSAPSFGSDRDDWPDPAELYQEFKTVTRGMSSVDARQAWDRHTRSLRT